MTVAAGSTTTPSTEAADGHRGHRRPADRPGRARGSTRNQPDMARAAQDFFPTSPIIGLLNPIAPPVRVGVVDGADGGYREIRGEANFDYPYEGPPTCVHGGVIAETVRRGAGCGQHRGRATPAMTGTLTVRYRKPDPAQHRPPGRGPVRRAGRPQDPAWGGIFHGDVLTAEAEGIFIEVRPSQMLAIAEANVDSADPGMLEAIRAEALREGAASDVQRPGGPPGPPDDRAAGSPGSRTRPSRAQIFSRPSQ